MQYTTKSRALSKSERSTAYTLARQMGAKYFPSSPLDGAYAIVDTINATVDGQVTLPLTVNNGI